MHLTREIVVSNKNFPECFTLFDLWSREAKEIENQAIFVMRQNFFSFGKEEKKLNKHEKSFFDLAKVVTDKYSSTKKGVCLTKTFLNRVFTLNDLFGDVDIYSKVKQNQINKVQEDFHLTQKMNE